ncbi:hypothetical protein BU25DRAFT_254074 [Macroventuria anomochaeta]|uniref:Uncharacterized protein n=1 Tax=Macroventuria anomochaeta TaxID=301207 RepID=A0ACB6RGQ8_9PLEO|nr:uncharacterized protein BU25DRAFT_254074 [Macroventuria anomochaeta]KAF2621071.1 hypothetical protein BU25DRAFT_254074 [Macroventuria anomochaeta]
MSQSMEPRSMDSYHTIEEITEMWRQLNRERSEWTLQQHEEWHTFLFYQCLARDRRYKRKTLSEYLPDTSWIFPGLFIGFLELLDNYEPISRYAVYSKEYIYEFICPDCSIRGIALIMMGALFGLVCLVHSSAVLLLAIWKHKRWLPFALALFWTTGYLLDEVQQLYKAWSG